MSISRKVKVKGFDLIIAVVVSNLGVPKYTLSCYIYTLCEFYNYFSS